MAERSNEQWIWALSERSSEAQGEALQDLHDFLLRAVLTYLAAQRSELGGWSQSDVPVWQKTWHRTPCWKLLAA
jgi:hypothetical protein